MASCRRFLLRLSWPRTTIAAALGCYLACLWLLAGPVYALDPNKRLTQYVHTSWRMRDGSAPGSPGNLRFTHLTTKAGFRGDREGKADSTSRNFQNIPAQGGHARVTDLKFTHLTTDDGLSQNNVVAILQDRRGFMWFATPEGLDRYDGNAFVAYKNDPNDPGSISGNIIMDLMEDDHGYLWVATLYGGVNKFDPRTERSTRYRHDPNKPNTISGDWVESIARDSRGYLWFGTTGSGLDKFDPATETFTHYRNDSDGQFVGRITHVIEDSHHDIWFVGERGLFHLNPQTGEITRPPATMRGLAADYVCEDNVGNFWMLTWSPIRRARQI